MRPCEICGNDIEETASVCHWCGSQQRSRPAAGGRGRGGRGGRMGTLDLEKDRPRVDEAIARLDMRLDTVRMQGGGLLRVVHGYGSSGTGGAIKDAVLSHLRHLRGRGLVRDFVWGGDYSERSGAGRALLGRHPKLRSSLRTDSGNPGITFVEI